MQPRLDIPRPEKGNVVFPDACGNLDLETDHPELKLTRVVRVLDYTMGKWIFRTVNESGHLGGREMKIAAKVGEFSSGAGVDEKVILSYTPEKNRVIGLINLDDNTVYCLANAFIPR